MTQPLHRGNLPLDVVVRRVHGQPVVRTLLHRLHLLQYRFLYDLHGHELTATPVVASSSAAWRGVVVSRIVVGIVVGIVVDVAVDADDAPSSFFFAFSMINLRGTMMR